MQLIKAFGKERSEIKSYITGLINNIRLSIKNAKLEIVGLFTNDFAQRAILGLIIFYGGYQVIKGKMTLGSLSAITLYLGQLSLLESRFAHFSQQISLGLVSSIRLEKILDTQPEFDESLYTKKVVFSDGEIEFENISFGYGQKSVLENLSFCIPGGACVGIAGPSGCGKTTIVNLILRLYQPFRGKISIDGCDIAIIDSKSFYEQIGASLQEPYLWNDTIENNIRYGKDNATFQDVQEAARIAGIDGFINTLQEGYKTIIGENACKISEGQKQRIAIARAVLKKPKILILDEAFASVDAQAEDRIINNIHMTLKNSTIIVISHRLSTINKMDLIYFLSSCNRIEIAKQEELLQQNAQYRNYLAHQLQ
jgi:ABC-type bacteriocin/lantibiotic exporter with double-glycine peptidase domain